MLQVLVVLVLQVLVVLVLQVLAVLVLQVLVVLVLQVLAVLVLQVLVVLVPKVLDSKRAGGCSRRPSSCLVTTHHWPLATSHYPMYLPLDV